MYFHFYIFIENGDTVIGHCLFTCPMVYVKMKTNNININVLL